MTLRLLGALGMAVALVPGEVFVQSGWTTQAPMPTARGQHAVAAGGGLVYAVGGDLNGGGGHTLSTLEAYDPVSDSWATKRPLPTPRYYLAAAMLNGVLYAVGGHTGTGGALANVDAYDPATNTWTARAPLPGARYSLGVAVVGGILYAVGGNNGTTGWVSTLHAYDPATNAWTARASMPTARGALAVGVVNGILYAIGGYNGGACCNLTTVEAYDPVSNRWTAKAPMPAARQSLAAVAVGGKLYAIGGGGDSGLLATVDSYDPASNSWAAAPPMSTARAYLAADALDGVIYAIGGFGQAGALSFNEAFTPAPPDTDADGVPDSIDSCLGTPSGQPVGPDGCTAAPADGDNDGVPDASDNCAAAANAGQADSDGDGMGDACDPNPHGPEAGLVSRWSAEGTANDSVGGNHGTLQGGAGFGPGKVGQAFAVDGVDDYIGIPDASSLDLTTQGSIAVWIYIDAFDQATGAGIFARDVGGYVLAVYSDNYGIPAKRRKVSWGRNGIDETVSTGTLTAGIWHHLAVTHSNGARNIYIDGVLNASGGGSNFTALSTPVSIGGYGFLPGWGFNGLVDELLVYNRALTAAEVQGIFAAAPPNDTDGDGQPNVVDPDDDGDDVPDAADAFPLDATKYAYPAALACGSAITSSTPGAVSGGTIQLTADIGSETSPCPGTALTVGVSSITLDLNGHTIWGSGLSAGIRFRNPFDVVNGAALGVAGIPTGVTITGPGTIRGFASGISLVNFSSANACPAAPCVPVFGGHTIRNLTVRNNVIHTGPTAQGLGILFALTSGNTVTGVTATANGVGISFASSDGNTIRANVTSGNTNTGMSWGARSSGGVIVGPPAQDNLVENNSVIGNGTNGIASGAQGVPPVSAVGIGNRVIDNIISFNGGGGIALIAEQGSLFQGNILDANENPGIFLAVGSGGFLSNNNTLIGNSARGNGYNPHAAFGSFVPPAVDLGDATTGAGTRGTANTWLDNHCGKASPRGLCDSTPPEVTPVVSGTPGLNGFYISDVSVTWTITDAQSTVVSTDGCGPASIASDTADTTLTCTADSDGGTTSIPLTIRRDANPPALALPDDITAEATSPSGAVVSYGVSATDAVDASPAIECSPLSGSTFPIGATTVSCRATDAAGNVSPEGTFQVTVTRLPTVVVVAPATGTYGGTTTLIATLTAAGSPLAGHVVNFTLNGALVGAGTTDSNGAATLSAVPLAGINASPTPYAGAIVADFAGDDTFKDSVGDAALTVNPKPASVTPSAAGKTYGDSDPALTGTLEGFLASDNVTATYSRTAGESVAGSPYRISAALSPAGVLGNYDITYDTANFVVTPAGTTTTVSSSVNPATPADEPTFTATIAVIAPGGGTPDGVVDFLDGTTVIGTGAVTTAGGAFVAAFTATLGGGDHTITARYVSASGNHQGSTSPAISQTMFGPPSAPGPPADPGPPANVPGNGPPDDKGPPTGPAAKK